MKVEAVVIQSSNVGMRTCTGAQEVLRELSLPRGLSQCELLPLA
jgi:hypothetical protein